MSKIKSLIVENNSNMALMFSRILGREGYDTVALDIY